MSMRCELTGKSFQTGNNVSHAKNRTKRRFKPNLQNISFTSEILGKKFQLKVAVSTIRTVEKKGGLDEFLINTPNSKLPIKAKKIKKYYSIKIKLKFFKWAFSFDLTKALNFLSTEFLWVFMLLFCFISILKFLKINLDILEFLYTPLWL
jgi:ribosomal protein L28